MTLKELLKQATPLPWCDSRTHPGVRLANGDGHQPAPQMSAEHLGGDWTDIGYFHVAADRDLAKHAVNVLPKLVEALEQCVQHLDPQLGNLFGVRKFAEATLKEANNPPV